MKTWLQGAGILALLALTGLCIELGWTLHLARPKILVTISNLDRATIAAGAAAGNVEKASRAWKKSSEEQALQTTQAMLNVSAAAKQLGALISKTDNSLNSNLFPTIQTTIADQNAALLQTQKELQAGLLQISSTTVQMQKLLTDGEMVIGSPALQQSIDNLAVSTQNTAEATKHLANIAADGEKTADYYTKRLTTPQGFAKTLLQAVLQLGSEARILFNK